MTNYEKFKNANIDELAKVILDEFWRCVMCEYYTKDCSCGCSSSCSMETTDCIEAVKEWLLSEVE